MKKLIALFVSMLLVSQLIFSQTIGSIVGWNIVKNNSATIALTQSYNTDEKTAVYQVRK